MFTRKLLGHVGPHDLIWTLFVRTRFVIKVIAEEVVETWADPGRKTQNLDLLSLVTPLPT